jgi:hypothetical protein
MSTKRCFTVEPCEFRTKCSYARTPLVGRVQFFYPRVNECQHYSPEQPPHASEPSHTPESVPSQASAPRGDFIGANL